MAPVLNKNKCNDRLVLFKMISYLLDIITFHGCLNQEQGLSLIGTTDPFGQR